MSGNSSIQVVGETLRWRARERPDKLFWWVGDDRATYAEADVRSDRVAAGLAEHGVRQGDRVAVLATNRWEYVEVILALAKLGAIQVPLNAYLRRTFLQYQLDLAEAQIVFADTPGIAALSEILDHLPALKKIIAFDDDHEDVTGTEIVPFGDIRSSGADVPRPELSPADLISIMYTSGTTGMPKGCMMPHGYYLNYGAEINGLFDVRDDTEVLFTALPLFHGHAQMGALTSALSQGFSVVIEPEFRASTVLDRWIETGATIFHAVGMMSMALLRLPPSDKDRDHQVRVGLSVPLPPPQQQQFLERFGVYMTTQAYAQTETGLATLARPGDAPVGAQGKPSPYREVAVVDDDDNMLPPGQVGEIVVRPKVPNVMSAGYWRQPEATVKAWRNLWHHTGDHGRFDEDGFLYFVDRKKDSLRRRGENISSMEVESAIKTNPKVADAAIVAVPSELTEDEVMACLQLAEGETVEPDEMFTFFKESLPYFVVPRYVRIVAELPKTPTLRVQKHLIRDEGITDDTWDFEAMGLRIERAERR